MWRFIKQRAIRVIHVDSDITRAIYGRRSHSLSLSLPGRPRSYKQIHANTNLNKWFFFFFFHLSLVFFPCGYFDSLAAGLVAFFSYTVAEPQREEAIRVMGDREYGEKKKDGERDDRLDV